MFHSARLKLTAWYLLSIMLISIIFSISVYFGSASEIGRGMLRQAIRSAQIAENQDQTTTPPPPMLFQRDHFDWGFPRPLRMIDAQIFEEARRRMASRLILLNLGIFVLAGAAGYLLSGQTLKPIEKMVDEQRRFVSDASHELRTPITAMRTEIEVALRDKNLDTNTAKEVLESSLEEINKLQQFSDHLLTLSRLQTQNRQKNNSNGSSEASLVEAVNMALQDIKSLAEAKNISVTTDIDDFKIKIDFGSLVKLFVIFLDNAIKYSNEGGRIELKTEKIKNKAIISIKDNGIGIRASDIPYIFNRFYRADPSRSRMNVEGYGLGLSIAKSIVDNVDGQIAVDSTPGQGTTFKITLPLIN